MHHAFVKCNYSPYSVIWDKVRPPHTSLVSPLYLPPRARVLCAKVRRLTLSLTLGLSLSLTPNPNPNSQP